MKTLIILATMALSVSAMAGDHQCGGSNPSWELTIKATSIVTKSGATDSITSRKQAINTKNDSALVVKTASGATATLVGGECTEGVWSDIYSKHIIYTTADGQVLYGCCNLRD